MTTQHGVKFIMGQLARNWGLGGAGMALFAVIILASCSGDLPATPEPAAGATNAPGSPATTPMATASSIPATAAPTSSPGSLPTGEQPQSSIVLFRNVVAGDYGILLLLVDGQVEFTGWNRLNQITMRRQGDIGADEARRIFQLFDEIGFNGLESEYDIYPLPEDDTTVYEDIYYLLQLNAGGEAKTVLAHEKALPPDLKGAVAPLLDLQEQLPEVPVQGSFLLAGEHAILGYKRFVQEEVILPLDEQEVDQYPLLQAALAHPFSLLPAENLATTKLGEVLSEAQSSVQISLGEQSYDVLLLSAP
ncbi:MAG: hypothetical protein ACRDIB_09925 [Ardenticatenaceae bacterium]